MGLFGPGRPVQAPTGTHPPSTDEEPAGKPAGESFLLGPVIGYWGRLLGPGCSLSFAYSPDRCRAATGEPFD